MRTLGILEMFKKCPKPACSQKAPLLLYCDALMQSSQAFEPVSLEEACECTKCVLELGTEIHIVYLLIISLNCTELLKIQKIIYIIESVL